MPALYSVYHSCIGCEWKNALLLSNLFVKANLSPAFLLLQNSEFYQPGDIQHRALCQYSWMSPWDLRRHSYTSMQQIIASLHEMGRVRVMTSSHQICLPRACCRDSRNKAMAGGLLSKWSCQALERRNQRQSGLIPTGDDGLSRCDWQDTRFGEKLFAWTVANCLQDLLLALHQALSLAMNSVC